MQAIANAEFLDVAKLRVELGNGLSVRPAFLQAAFLRETGGPGALDDLVFQEAQASPVESTSAAAYSSMMPSSSASGQVEGPRH